MTWYEHFHPQSTLHEPDPQDRHGANVMCSTCVVVRVL